MNFLDGYKTYIAAAGLFALGIYHLTQGDVPQAVQDFMAALAALGLRSAIKRDIYGQEAKEKIVPAFRQPREN